MSNNAVLLVDGHHGVYVPQFFAESYFDENQTENLSQTQINILKVGPDHHWYWETWEEVLNNAILIGKDKTRFRLWQDGDLWAYPEDMEWPDECW